MIKEMMKYSVVMLFACLGSLSLRAQTSTKNASATNADSTNTTLVVKHAKVRVVNGTPMTSARDLIENISMSKDHTTFVKALAIAGLSETLKSKGPMTIFAPTNSAFDKLPAGRLDTLLKKEHNLELTQFLSYSIIPGKYTSKDIAKQINKGKGSATFTTLSGSRLIAKINADRNIVLTDDLGNESVISQFDIEQSNGILNITNSLLMPKTN